MEAKKAAAKKIAKKLGGLNTLDMVKEKLSISRSTAMKTIHLLRKEGLVYTKGAGRQRRLYEIRPEGFMFGNEGMYDIINKYSRVKVRLQVEHKVIGRKISVEETIVRAVATREYRTIVASLGLFNHVKNWSRLYRYARHYNLCHDVGALYDAAKTIIKVRKMDGRIRYLLKKHNEKSKFVIKGLKSKDFQEIEKEWKVKLPLNKTDLLRYKEE